MKILAVIDMQNDFITGPLGTEEARAIVPNVIRKVAETKLDENTRVVFTQDTHRLDYLDTAEGEALPVPHCISRTPGWCLISELREYAHSYNTIYKNAFGTLSWHASLPIEDIEDLTEIEIIGVCTDICIVSNALILKATFPEIPITVDASCCAGTTPEMHKKALDVMESCQIKVINEGEA